jgi:hypothetical protein
VVRRVLLRCVLVVLGRMQGVTVRDLGMMRRFFVIAGPVVLGGFAMMLGRILMMFRRHFVVFMNVMVAHRSLPAMCLIHFENCRDR